MPSGMSTSQLAQARVVSIIGPSGSGKTALLNMLGCLDTLSTGRLLLNAADVAVLREKDLVKLRRENIGFVFQQFYLMPTLTARENIELPLLFSKKKVDGGRIDEILGMVGLAEIGDHLPGQLSGGEMPEWRRTEMPGADEYHYLPPATNW
jgi:putative ABC transport system ATP-binding protein